jgi:hypothetical protein
MAQLQELLLTSGQWTPYLGGGTSEAVYTDRSSLDGLEGSYEPSYETTGLLPGYDYDVVTGSTNLPHTHSGDWVITEAVAAGFVDRTIKDYVVNGKIQIKAANVTISNCWIRGLSTPGNGNQSLVECGDVACTNALISDCVLIPQTPTYGWNLIQGHDYEARRVYGKWTVDGFRVYNNNTGMQNTATNVQINACFAEDFAYFYNDPNHPNDHRTHNDWIQIEGGAGTQLIGNKMIGRMAGYTDPDTGVVHPLWPNADLSVSDTTDPSINVWAPYWATNGGSTYGRFGWTPATSLVQCIQNVGQITDLLIDRNWAYSGATMFNSSNGGLYPPPVPPPYTNLGIWSNNRFNRTSGVAGSTIAIAYGVNYSLSTPGNSYIDNGAPANVRTQTS